MIRSVIASCMSVILSLAWGTEDLLLQHAMERYGFESWKEWTREDYPAPVSRFTLPELVLPTNGMDLVSRVLPGRGTDQTLQITREDEVLLAIDVGVAGSVVEAHREIVTELSSLTSTQPFSVVTNEIGDIMVFKSSRDRGRVMFARNNVFFIVDQESPLFSATNIAQQIDAAILRASGVLR